MPSLAIPNCVYNGLNGSTVANSVTAGSIKLGGTATSLLLGNGTTIAGTAAQYVMGNGTLLTAAYPTFVRSSFNATFSGGTGGGTSSVTINYRRTTNGTQSVITLMIPQILLSTGSAALTIQTTANVLPAGMIPSTNQYIPVPIRITTVSSIGVFLIFSTGQLAIVAPQILPPRFPPVPPIAEFYYQRKSLTQFNLNTMNASKFIEFF